MLFLSRTFRFYSSDSRERKLLAMKRRMKKLQRCALTTDLHVERPVSKQVAKKKIKPLKQILPRKKNKEKEINLEDKVFQSLLNLVKNQKMTLISLPTS